MGTMKLKTSGREADVYVLTNSSGMRVELTNYGATLMKLYVKDRQGNPVNVVLGYDTLDAYEKGGCYFGAVVGRVANRIADASFELNGTKYFLTANDQTNALHGGRDFYHTRMWTTEASDEKHVRFGLVSKDGDQGFPGNLKIAVQYELTEENELKIQYRAISDEDTLLNLTNHSYFNLNGQGTGTVLDQEAAIHADGFTEIDEKLIPTGNILPVEGTPLDFRSYKKIGKDIEEDYPALKLAGGYDHNMVLCGQGYRKVAEMRSATTGIAMEVFTDLPGMQFYTANFVNHERGVGGTIYQKRDAACFETQFFPDAIHHEEFQSPVLKKAEEFVTETAYRFTVLDR